MFKLSTIGMVIVGIVIGSFVLFTIINLMPGINFNLKVAIAVGLSFTCIGFGLLLVSSVKLINVLRSVGHEEFKGTVIENLGAGALLLIGLSILLLSLLVVFRL